MALKIAVMGAGGIGGYFGGRLAAAGEDVQFIARGAHLRAMLEQGLDIISPLGDAHVDGIRATDDPAAIGPVDVVLFCVKLYDVEAAAELCRPLIGPDTVVISLLNGIDSEDRLAAILGAEHVAGGIAYIPSNIREPGVIEHKAQLALLQFGELDGRASPRLEAFQAACERSGVQAQVVDDIEAAIWMKFAGLAPMAVVCCLTRLGSSLAGAHREVTALFRAAVEEVVAVARAKGVALPDDVVESRMAFISGFGAGKPSMLVDLEQGKRIEIEGLPGAVLLLGAELGVPTPVHQVAYAALKPHADGAPGD
ncbi:MAG: 2-dehydropantoate 2-reductase [Alphaproteobacteria bacterium]|jgi:2-dehydropantoate 2-reductase|nr:2-dehydropantoate 2-reductase [Alphaproteobacteria bacterium]MDP6567658.1 2-dehydropantoate 2-reductase [Alphaproteobacteria bacterium]MDP6813206.1 2-dehydropantoate 2-reductase [Alphaproteobacteria bacterium]